MPPQNILISLRCAPLHQDILHRGLTNGSIQFILKKERERLSCRSQHKVIFLQLIVFTEFFRRAGKRLGRPKQHETGKKSEYKDNTDRIEVEREFSLVKRKFGLGLLCTKL